MSRLIRVDAKPFAIVTMLLFAFPSSGIEAVSHRSSSAVQMALAAQAFIDLLDEERRDVVVHTLDDKDRTTWSNLPIIMVEPNGILLRDLDSAQRRAVHDMLRASLSAQGYAKMTGVMVLEDLLYEIESATLMTASASEDIGLRRGFVETRHSGNYAVAVFGEPGDTNWGWKIAGHHAAMNFTVAQDKVGFTPTFLGSAPKIVQDGRYAGWSALPHEGSRGIELMRSLTAEQQESALINTEVADDVFEGPGRRASLSEFEGIRANEFSSTQMQLLRVLVDEYVRNADFDTADAHLTLIEKLGWGKLWFSWRGDVDPDGRFYYRVHGPRLLIEYNRQNPNHDHMIVRDPVNDYGEDWLGKHYKEHHPTMSEAMEAARQRIASETE